MWVRHEAADDMASSFACLETRPLCSGGGAFACRCYSRFYGSASAILDAPI